MHQQAPPVWGLLGQISGVRESLMIGSLLTVRILEKPNAKLYQICKCTEGQWNLDTRFACNA